MDSTPEIHVMFYRMNTGEDIVCEANSIDESKVEIINPLKIVYSLNEQTGMINVSLIQWVFPKISEKESFIMSTNNIIIHSLASIDMTSYYYKSLDRIQQSIVTKATKPSPYDEDDEDDDLMYDEDGEVPEYIKEKLDEILKNKKRLH